MTHVYAIGHLLGRPGSAALVDHGLDALRGAFHDAEHGGWFAEVARDGTPVDTDKAAYPHAFVILATSSATAAGRPGARALLDEALAVVRAAVLGRRGGMSVEQWDRTFTTLDGYRGVNANMHTVEAYLAAADVDGRPGLARPRAADRRSGWCTASPRRTRGASPSTSTPPGTPTSSTTSTRPRTRSVPTARRSATGWSGRG